VGLRRESATAEEYARNRAINVQARNRAINVQDNLATTNELRRIERPRTNGRESSNESREYGMQHSDPLLKPCRDDAPILFQTLPRNPAEKAI